MVIVFHIYQLAVETKPHRDWLQDVTVARLDLSATAAESLKRRRVLRKKISLDIFSDLHISFLRNKYSIILYFLCGTQSEEIVPKALYMGIWGT